MTMNLIEPAIPEQKVTSVWQRSSRFIVCSFCGLRGRQVRDLPLCSNCLIDPVQTRIAIEAQLDGWLAQQVKALETWDAIREPRQAAWELIQDARLQPDYTARCAAHRAAGNVYGVLLDAQAAYETALEPLAAERARLERALEVLESLPATGPIVVCRDCNTTFEDLNGHGLCDGCLCEHINGAGILELDDE